MKSVHVVYGFYPEPVGGTEVYVSALASALIRLGHPATIAAPASEEQDYRHEDVPVRRFAVTNHLDDVAQLYDEGDLQAARNFAGILDRERFDVVHMHALTRACSVRVVRAAHARGIPVVFTYHTPTVSCSRGTLMLWGTTRCDGVLQVKRCTACTLEGRGLPRGLAQALGHLPPTRLGVTAKLRGRAWTALRFSSLIRVQQATTHALFDEVDRIIALREWVRALLVANGVPDGKIVSSKHALCHPVRRQRRESRRPGPLRVVFMGRLDPTKGLDVLIGAIRAVPGVTLDVYGTVQGSGGDRELARLQQLTEGDPRVVFRPRVDSAAVVDTIAAYDVLAVPSQWMETGPLVVLEAFAAGVPVIGSALGGIAELVSDGVNGMLVADFRSPRAWAEVIERLNSAPQSLRTLGAGIDEPATMDRVATEMLGVYQALTPLDREG